MMCRFARFKPNGLEAAPRHEADEQRGQDRAAAPDHRAPGKPALSHDPA